MTRLAGGIDEDARLLAGLFCLDLRIVLIPEFIDAEAPQVADAQARIESHDKQQFPADFAFLAVLVMLARDGIALIQHVHIAYRLNNLHRVFTLL